MNLTIPLSERIKAYPAHACTSETICLPSKNGFLMYSGIVKNSFGMTFMTGLYTAPLRFENLTCKEISPGMSGLLECQRSSWKRVSVTDDAPPT